MAVPQIIHKSFSHLPLCCFCYILPSQSVSRSNINSIPSPMPRLNASPYLILSHPTCIYQAISISNKPKMNTILITSQRGQFRHSLRRRRDCRTLYYATMEQICQGDSGGEEMSETSARASSMFMTSVVSSK